MAYSSRILETAYRELEDAVRYLAAYSKDAAASLLDGFEAELDLICSGVVSFALSRMPALAAMGYRCALVGDYLFLYYIEDEAVVVAHFFHQRQDYASIVRAKAIDAM